MKKKQKSDRKGFTMIELMVVVLIAVIMTTVFFVNYNSNDKKAKTDVENAARQVAAQLRALQNEAISGKTFEVNGNLQYAHYYFFITDGSSIYTLSYFDGMHAYIVGSSQQFDLAKNRVTISTNPVSFYFESPLGKTNGPKDVVITSDLVDSMVRHVCVSTEGNITEQEAACI
ncbi:MAG: type II secretion system protein [Candidatus Moranbacteria bacterium]|nr:type II secretion system protein [Candidatus Moranbacteria bacterium]